MHDILFDGQAKKVAATCDELSREQLLALMPILYGTYSDANRQRIEVLQVLFGISLAMALRITPVQYCQILCLTDFLLGEQLTFTKQLLPWVAGKWHQRRLYGPADGFQNVRFLEFVFADSYFMAYAKGHDPKWLHHLVAVLYRPQRWPHRPRAASYGGDRRQDFNQALIDERVPRVAQLPLAEQLAILTWYRGCRRALELRYPLVFEAPAPGQATGNAGGWDQALREMSGQAFGNFAETGRQHLHTVLAKMNDDIHRAQELERQAKAQNPGY